MWHIIPAYVLSTKVVESSHMQVEAIYVLSKASQIHFEFDVLFILSKIINISSVKNLLWKNYCIIFNERIIFHLKCFTNSHGNEKLLSYIIFESRLLGRKKETGTP